MAREAARGARDRGDAVGVHEPLDDLLVVGAVARQRDEEVDGAVAAADRVFAERRERFQYFPLLVRDEARDAVRDVGVAALQRASRWLAWDAQMATVSCALSNAGPSAGGCAT